MTASLPPPQPTPIALVLCEGFYRETSGKTALVGMFNHIRATHFPVIHPQLVVFASLTGVRNQSVANLELVHRATDTIIVRTENPLPVKDDPVGVVDLTFIFHNVALPEPGTYDVRLWANQHLLLMRPFHVSATRPPRQQAARGA